VTGGRRLAICLPGLLLLPALALAGHVFQWTDERGQIHFTDNLWDVPEGPRRRYLEMVEEEARTKLTPQQIRDLKTAGNWPPLEFIRPRALKTEEQLKEWMGFRLVGSDLQLHRRITDEFRYQWDSFYEERKQAQQAITEAQATLQELEQQLDRARLDDMVMGRLGEAAQAQKVEKDVVGARAALQGATERVASLPAKENALLLGQRVFRHSGEDGGPGTFGLPR
jgi:hypothetical protein